MPSLLRPHLPHPSSSPPSPAPLLALPCLAFLLPRSHILSFQKAPFHRPLFHPPHHRAPVPLRTFVPSLHSDPPEFSTTLTSLLFLTIPSMIHPPKEGFATAGSGWPGGGRHPWYRMDRTFTDSTKLIRLNRDAPPVSSMKLRCSSCGIPIVGTGFSKFKCPGCGSTEQARCRQCRDQSVQYVCQDCGFVGP